MSAASATFIAAMKSRENLADSRANNWGSSAMAVAVTEWLLHRGGGRDAIINLGRAARASAAEVRWLCEHDPASPGLARRAWVCVRELGRIAAAMADQRDKAYLDIVESLTATTEKIESTEFIWRLGTDSRPRAPPRINPPPVADTKEYYNLRVPPSLTASQPPSHG